MAAGTDHKKLVLIAVDSSAQAENAFNWYMDNCHQPSNHIIVAHCVHMPTAYGVTDPYVYNALIDEVKVKADAVQKKFTDLLQSRGVSGTFISSVEQHPEVWLVEKAKQEKPQLLVMGSRGLGTVRRTILGSVSDYVLHHAHCAVAICRKQEHSGHHHHGGTTAGHPEVVTVKS